MCFTNMNWGERFVWQKLTLRLAANVRENSRAHTAKFLHLVIEGATQICLWWCHWESCLNLGCQTVSRRLWHLMEKIYIKWKLPGWKMWYMTKTNQGISDVVQISMTIKSAHDKINILNHWMDSLKIKPFAILRQNWQKMCNLFPTFWPCQTPRDIYY